MERRDSTGFGEAGRGVNGGRQGENGRVLARHGKAGKAQHDATQTDQALHEKAGLSRRELAETDTTGRCTSGQGRHGPPGKGEAGEASHGLFWGVEVWRELARHSRLDAALFDMARLHSARWGAKRQGKAGKARPGLLRPEPGREWSDLAGEVRSGGFWTHTARSGAVWLVVAGPTWLGTVRSCKGVPVRARRV